MNQPDKPIAGKTPAADSDNSIEALRAKTERLRALRLARDAANPQVAPARKSGGGKSRATKKQPAGSLSDWLNGQSKEGRRT